MDKQFSHFELESQCDKIMDEFDFQNVHDYMILNGRTWQIGEGLRLPSLDELKAYARSFMTKAIYHDKPSINVGSGSFTAYKFPWGMKLSFEIQQSSF